jgi:hypothetical protein
MAALVVARVAVCRQENLHLRDSLLQSQVFVGLKNIGSVLLPTCCYCSHTSPQNAGKSQEGLPLKLDGLPKNADVERVLVEELAGEPLYPGVEPLLDKGAALLRDGLGLGPHTVLGLLQKSRVVSRLVRSGLFVQSESGGPSKEDQHEEEEYFQLVVKKQVYHIKLRVRI